MLHVCIIFEYRKMEASEQTHVLCSHIWNETWLSGLFFKPCNYKLFVKQFLNIEMAIVFARVSCGPQQHKTQQCSPHFSTVFCVKKDRVMFRDHLLRSS